jgi:hypothetical protein
MGSLLMSEIRRSGDLSRGTPGRTTHAATSLALRARPSHFVQTTSIPNTRRSSSDHLMYLKFRFGFSCSASPSAHIRSLAPPEGLATFREQ